MMTSTSTRKLAVLFAVAALSACGGSENEGVGPQPNTPIKPINPNPFPGTNSAPVAMAGKDQNVIIGSRVVLDGSSSWDANDNPLVFKWVLTSKPAGSNASLVSANGVRPMFVADLEGTYTATLIINDGLVDSQPSTVTITATRDNAAPVANAGDNQNVLTGVVITLDGSASYDANRDNLGFKWSLTSRPNGSTAKLNSPTSANPTFTADKEGVYVATLVVNDGMVDSRPATVTVYATQANAAPVANAGVNQSALRGSTILLDGSASSDANGDVLSYRWTLAVKPPGSNAAISSANTVRPTLFLDAKGEYVARLIVNDGKVDSEPATVTITASSDNAAPVAHAGTPQNVTTNTIVTLDGTRSSDANGDPLTYRWVLTSRPVGSLSSLLGANTAQPTFITDVPGSYVASLIVNDGQDDSAPAQVTVTASAANATIPVANAGVGQTVAAGTTSVALNGSASSSASGNPLTYRWSLVSKPAGSTAALSSTTVANPTLTAMNVAGDHVLRLVVNDGKADSQPVSVIVTLLAREISLWRVETSGSGSSDTLMSWPYTTQSTVMATCVAPACTAPYKLASFKLVAPAGQNYTITGLTAQNVTAGGSTVVPSFGGLANGQTIAAGTTASFDLLSQLTATKTVNLRYQFKIAETGQMFDYSVSLKTN